MQHTSPFKGRKLVVATMHGKERVIAPLLEEHLGVKVVVPQDFDSDRFGTFTREVKRAGNQLEAARAKARVAMENTGTDLAVASEGSFGAHPSLPFIDSNLELVLLLDALHGYEIRGHHRTTETNLDECVVTNVEEARAFARKIGFPEHGIIVRTGKRWPWGIHKEIRTEEALVAQVDRMLKRPFVKRVFLETDMRAHKNPTRMRAIEKATEDLLQHVNARCSRCHAPGFHVTNIERGLPCAVCALPTDMPLYEMYQCDTCGHTEKTQVTQYGNVADPKYCGRCNP